MVLFASSGGKASVSVSVTVLLRVVPSRRFIVGAMISIGTVVTFVTTNSILCCCSCF